MNSSLQRIVEERASHLHQGEAPFALEALNWSNYLVLSGTDRETILARYLRFLGKSDFQHTQIREIRRQLDKNQIQHSFKVAGLEWHINAERFYAVRL